MTGSLDIVAEAVSRWLGETPHPLVLGICGSQGSGKSTLAAALAARLAGQGLRAATLSLDDLYLGKAARSRLARDIHPLLATRGVPLTHDVARGGAIIDAAKAGLSFDLPRFDKACDEPMASGERIDGRLDLLILEGWCVGAAPQDDAALACPVNALECDEDGQGEWRRAVNAALAGPYQSLFAKLDRLVLLAAPDFEVVRGWRTQQEHALRDRLAAEGRDPGLAMDDEAIGRFVAHYERLTRAILTEMPARADLTLQLDTSRTVRTAIFKR